MTEATTHDEATDQDHLVASLASLGEVPGPAVRPTDTMRTAFRSGVGAIDVEPAVVPRHSRSRRIRRVLVVGGAVTAGTLGLGVAGALPGPAQSAFDQVVAGTFGGDVAEPADPAVAVETGLDADSHPGDGTDVGNGAGDGAVPGGTSSADAGPGTGPAVADDATDPDDPGVEGIDVAEDVSGTDLTDPYPVPAPAVPEQPVDSGVVHDEPPLPTSQDATSPDHTARIP